MGKLTPDWAPAAVKASPRSSSRLNFGRQAGLAGTVRGVLRSTAAGGFRTGRTPKSRTSPCPRSPWKGTAQEPHTESRHPVCSPDSCSLSPSLSFLLCGWGESLTGLLQAGSPTCRKSAWLTAGPGGRVLCLPAVTTGMLGSPISATERTFRAESVQKRLTSRLFC